MRSFRVEDNFETEVNGLYRIDTKVEDSKTEDKVPYLILVDPELRTFYRLDMNSFNKTYEIILNKNMEKDFTNTITDTLRSIKKICMTFSLT